MRKFWTVVVAAFASCVLQGPLGPEGSRGPQGPAGIPGPAGALSIVWVDAAGVVVGPAPLVFDSAGTIWSVDVESGGVQPIDVGIRTLFAAAGCSGPAYFFDWVRPRAAFVAFPDGGIRTRPDTARAEPLPWVSYLNADGGCLASSGAIQPMVQIQGAPISAPSLRFLGPLHQELR